MALSRGSKIFSAVLLVVVLAVGGGLLHVKDLLAGVPGSGDPVEVEVDTGATAASIGQVLVERGVVSSAIAFRLVARSRGLDAQLRAGTYDLETGMGIEEAIDVLLRGPRAPDQIRFTVQEGLPVVRILQRLGEQFPNHSRKDFRAVLDQHLRSGDVLTFPSWVPALSELDPQVKEPFEGLLFPETYFVLRETTPAEVIQRMVDQLTKVVDSIPAERVRAAEQAGLSVYDVLTIASLIERETRVDEEREIVSGVIRNRLAEGQPLQIDATVLYALGEHDEQVLYEDTEVDDPYNTYRVAGLPPGPIAAPGAASIEAAFAPAEVPYRYYVLSPECDGSHVFAETLDEHNRNVAAFRDAGRCLE